MFSQKNSNRPIFSRMADISMADLPKPTNKKSKITKTRFFLKIDLEVVAYSESVQNTSKTPKLSISDHISSLKSELPPKNSSRKCEFFAFLRILRKTKSSYQRSSQSELILESSSNGFSHFSG